jgi:hypothetical protein
MKSTKLKKEPRCTDDPANTTHSGRGLFLISSGRKIW